MFPTCENVEARLSACRTDLMQNGIDVNGMDRKQLRKLVAGYLEYFQMMLGSDGSCREIVRQFEQRRMVAGGRANGARRAH